MKKTIICFVTMLLFASCNEFLDRNPIDEISPDVYFTSSEQLAAYSIGRYNFRSGDGSRYDLLTFKRDNDTDVQLSSIGDIKRWVPSIWAVPSDHGTFVFDKIYSINYFFEKTLPKFKARSITGNPNDVAHYIGEMYMLRAVEYFEKLQLFGDYPILKNTISLDEKEALVAANERRPMNEVGRFILHDLDSAIMLMAAPASDDGGRGNRLTKEAALLLKSRVGLYLGSWLTNFRNTPFVPGGAGWPGASKSYNSGFSINLDEEINFFLTEAMDAAQQVADSKRLTENNQHDYHLGDNPYVLMYTDRDLSVYDEVIFWSAHSRGLNPLGYGFVHSRGGAGSGYSRAYVNSFLDVEGLPIYASNSYAGDETLADVKTNRDNRLVQFMKIKGEALSVRNDGTLVPIGPPALLTTAEYKSATGYDLKKGLTMRVDDKTGPVMDCGVIEYRAAEAYLNYIEACYLKTGAIDEKASGYWKAIRTRAGVNPDFNKTIAATDMSKEADLLSAYTAGQLVDATMYNIRRERACELMSEGFRWDDLRRWRSMDQLIHQRYIPEGFKLWGAMQNDYLDKETSVSKLYYLGDDSNKKPNVSSPTLGDYLRPYQIIKQNNNLYDGYAWMAAYYLNPIGMSQFNITSSTAGGGLDYASSPLYQNPGWPSEAGGKAAAIADF